MKANVNDNCIGCGMCASIGPEVFEMTDDGVARAIGSEVPNGSESQAIEARDECPVSAIDIEEE
ncbi:MAG: ferredoxin [Clostridiales bacterium]|nr:ferredoxin [Clostridiales bacterium]